MAIGQAASIIAALLGLSQQGAGLGLDLSGWSANGGAESNAATWTSVGGDLGAIAFRLGGPKAVSKLAANMPASVQNTIRGNLLGPNKATFAKSLSIIAWTMTAVDIAELTTGFGSPYQGDNLKAGSQHFAAVVEQLKSATPGEGWQGLSSEKYAGQDTTLGDVAQQLADLDLKLAALVKNQAEPVDHVRLGFGILKDLLVAAMVVEILIMFTVPAPAGPVASKVFAITVAVLGIGAALAFIGVLVGYSLANGMQADLLTAQYEKLTQTAQLPGNTDAKLPVSTVAETTFSTFKDTSAGQPLMSAMPDASKEPAGDGASADASDGAPANESAPLSALAAEGETPGDGSPEEPDTPDETTPSTPAFTMPTLAQLAQMSGQAAKLTGHASQHMNLFNQAMGQVQQIAQMAQQGQGAAAPAEEAAAEEAALAGAAPAEAALAGAVPAEATLAGDVESAGAGAGAEAAERAPVEVAAVGAEPGTGAPGRVI